MQNFRQKLALNHWREKQKPADERRLTLAEVFAKIVRQSTKTKAKT